MAIPFNAVSNAYASAAKLMGQQAKSSFSTTADAGGGGDFAKMLGQAVQGVVDTGKASEAQATAMVNGKADMVDVVTAISKTELAMETMVSVRDRVISAYEEIMKMPI